MNKPGKKHTPLFVSVIIPVYNDSNRLKLCLQALEKQTYPSERYEVIVVDNNSTEDINSTLLPFGHAKYTFEKQPGSYSARNNGIRIAKGEIIAFTDSDCIPTPNWIEKGVGNLLSTLNCGLIAGKIKIFPQDPNRLSSVELYESLYGLPQEKYLKIENFGATANVFTFKKVIEKVGLFNDKLKSGGDREWGNRVNAYGYQLGYAEDACVLHPARHSFKQLSKKFKRLVGGHEDIRGEKTSASNLIDRKFISDLLPPFRDICKIIKKDDFSLLEKIKIISVMFFISFTKTHERLRLRLGGSSKR